MNSPDVRHSGVRDIRCGHGVVIVDPVNLYECELGDEVFVGPFVEIQSGVVIGAKTRIQSHAFVCECVSIGERCFISHGAMFINDPFALGGPAGGNQSLWRETIVENDVSIGTNATIMPVRIARGCVVGAGAVVTRDLTTRGVYAGNPARLIREL